jgi:NADPH:quinone reductase-like Zn-dependent oxidoreductase
VVIAGSPDTAAAEARGVRTSGTNAPAVTSPILQELARLAEAGDLRPQVGPTFPLADAAGAHALSETGHGRGRIVLTVAS